MSLNSSKILKYFILWGLLSFFSLKVKSFILNKLALNGLNEISNPFISFYEVHNTGAAFNLFTDRVNALILTAVIFIIILTALILAKTSKLSQNMVSAMALLSSGMTLNTLERIQNGYVTDYIFFTFFKNFPVFNIPDIFIVIGALMLAFSLSKNKRSCND